MRRLNLNEAPASHPPSGNATGIRTIVESGVLPPVSAVIAPPGRDRTQFHRATVQDYAEAYRAGTACPEGVAERVLAAITESDQPPLPLRAFVAWDRDDVMRQARDSAARHRAGRPLSVFDGVPLAVKDEVDMVPFPTKVGTRFLGREPAREDSTVVARMRAAGALLIGKTNMHEIGLGVTGFNPHHGTPRNPYNLAHHTGGSSSGSAAAVAAGICPVAISADGGGSVRIPAAFCGVVGIKPTWGRVSEHGAAPLCWSVAHIGPHGATVLDTAVAYMAMAGADLKDPNTLRQPPATLAGFDQNHLNGLRIGIDNDWFDQASGDVIKSCREQIARLVELGAEVRDIRIPDLAPAQVAHAITITTEMAAAMAPYDSQHRRDFGHDVRLSLALARSLGACDYIHAQRMRARLIAHFEQAFHRVDVIITPTTPRPAPRIRTENWPLGESDLMQSLEIMRFVTAANFTGLPAISVPVGQSSDGLPIGLQVIGRWWEENILFRVARMVEHSAKPTKPALCYSPLPLADC